MRNRYKSIIKQDKDLWNAANSVPAENDFDIITWNVISPVIVLYTLWIITQAEERGIRRLYFLARDGYYMYGIARQICSKRNNNIKCSYFYCSRYALRMAAYRFKDESAYNKLFIHAYRLTAADLLKRAGFDKDKRKKVYEDISFSWELEEQVMQRSEFELFCSKLKKSGIFIKLLTELSDAAYPDIIAYIRQEDIHKFDRIGIADLGWTGSLQFTLKRLLESDNIKTKITGFYMGMLEKPPYTDNSEYVSWLFDEKSLLIKSWFAHNLIECICSAPHGMTVGYKSCDGQMVPVLSKNENASGFNNIINKIVFSFSEKLDIQYKEKHKKIALQLLHKLMFSPTGAEAEILGQYHFCDDVGEQYHRNIVQVEDNCKYRRELIFFKLFNRSSADGFYWYHGSVQASRLVLKTFYRYEYLFTRYVIMLLKRG